VDDDFTRLTNPYRPELLTLCYRMLGSIHDAEDQVQETLLRAWRGHGRFEGRASMRTWLYRIAVNACLRDLERRARRPLPAGLGAPITDPEAPLVADPEVPWLQPIPTDPARVVADRAGLRLALVAALQYLPPRQRAVLILRDVLDWRAAEVADLLGTSAAAVNSLLQRAREHLAVAAPSEDAVAEPTDAEQRRLLDRYTRAFAEADIAALMTVLTEDAVAEMPPNTGWFAGRDALGRFLARHILRRPGDVTLIGTWANGQPAFAAYLHGAAHSIQVLTVTKRGISRVVSFQDRTLFPAFDLPLRCSVSSCAES
jgi:RNA polymerase sigma-70 factor, ECF subfamily